MSVASHGYLKNHKSYFEKLPKNLKMTPLIVENEFPKKIKSLQFIMVQCSLNPTITFLGERL